MLVKKICMIGDFAVGKTSLVARFVHTVFSDKYLTTVGVKIDTKALTLEDARQCKLILWDIAGSSALTTVERSYLKGAAGYLLVVDGTRRSTLDAARQLHAQVRETMGELPFQVLINKADLSEQWEIGDDDIKELERAGWPVTRSSAKSGAGVEDSFKALAACVA